MKGKIITVFGAAGFVGRTLVELLAKQGALIRAVVTNADSALFLKVMGEPGQITLLTVDFFNPHQVEAACANAWSIVNLIGTLIETRQKTYDYSHVDIPEAIARACQNQRVERFIHTSAVGARSESDSDYLCTKGLGEEKASQLFPNVTIARPALIFGPHDRFFNLIASLLAVSPVFPIFGNGKAKQQPVYVGDVSKAIVNILNRQETRAQIFELGGPTVYSFESLIELTIKMTKRKRTVIRMPYIVGQIMATVLQLFPRPVLTLEQLKLLQKDNVADPEAKLLKDLSINATPLEAILPTYLNRYQPAF